MLDVCLALGLLALGYWAGKRSVKTAAPPQPSEQEAQRLREDRAAFHQLMGYSADRAYGLQDD